MLSPTGDPFSVCIVYAGRTASIAGIVYASRDHKRYGVAVVPVFIAERELKTGALRAVLRTTNPLSYPCTRSIPPTRHLAVKVRLFIDFLVRQIG